MTLVKNLKLDDDVSTGSGSGDMLSTNNLSDVANVATARTNLGLNTTANQTDSADKRFVSDAQETKLDAISGTNTGDETAARIATIITGAGAEIPLDADEFTFYKVVGTLLKKVTWANIKATLKTYFDGLYSVLAHTHTESQITDLVHNDVDAIHISISGEIFNLVEKNPPIGNDMVLIEDSESGSEKRKALFNNFPISSAVSTALSGKQATLVSGTNIKTVNSNSLLGAGDIVISGSTNIKETEIDFGDGNYITEGEFTVTDAEISTANQIIAQVAIKSPSDGRSVDEILWEELICMCQAGTGNFILTVKSLCGSVNGKFIINYLVG